MLSLGLHRVRRHATRFAQEEDAQGLVEYALILGLIALGVLVAMTFLAGGIGDAFEMIADHVESVTTQEDPIEVGRRHGRGWCKKHGC
jgi:Flp pilus assembly pilin Flp